MNKRDVIALMLVCGLAGSAPAIAQVGTNQPPVVPGAAAVKVERIRIHGAALAGNLEGNTVDRDALVLLPPGYDTAAQRRYPVVYALHGYSIGAEQWSQEIHVPQTIEGAFANGAREPRARRTLNGWLWRNANQHEALGRLWQCLHHEPMLHAAARS